MRGVVLIALLSLVAGSTAFAATATWSSGWSGGDGPGGAPDSDDAVVISAGDLNWDTNLPATVASWTQGAGYADTVTFETRYADAGAFTNFTITGNCTIDGGTWTHADNSTGEVYRLHVTVGGDFALGSGATNTADQLGYDYTYGPAGKSGNFHGGSHGGRGGDGRSAGSAEAPAPYGSITEPVNLGCAGGHGNSKAGGAIRLIVAGTTTVDGRITALGRDASQFVGGGAGGSVWITTGALSGGGSILASGGSAYNGGGQDSSGGGGGGRIAVVVTNDTSFGSVTVRADGGAPKGGGNRGRAGAAGTVYLEHTGHATGQGHLVIDNADHENLTVLGVAWHVQTLDHATELAPTGFATYSFAEITLTNAGVLGVNSNATLIVSNATLHGDAADPYEGIRLLDSGTLLAPPTFALTNYFIGIHSPSATFSPASSLTIATNARLIVNRPHSMTTDVTVAVGGTITHDENWSAEDNRADLSIDGNLTIDAGAVVDVDNLGWVSGSGLSLPPGGNYYGGSHGGRGGSGQQNGSGTPSGITYGSIITPTNIGSAGGHVNSDGGGAIRFAVTGATTLNGTITADGKDGSQFVGGGSGGSVYLESGTLAGSGTIRADGGNAYDGGGQAASGGGGGGRISVRLSAGTSFGGVAMQAYGGLRDDIGTGIGRGGAAGTIYLETQGQLAGEGRLLIDNDGRSAQHGSAISSNVTDATLGEVLIQDGGRLSIDSNQAIMVSRVWSNGSDFVAERGGAVHFIATNTMQVYGGSTFRVLICSNLAKVIQFPTAATNTVVDNLVLVGEPTTNLLLRSLLPGTQWPINLAASATQTIEYVDVEDSNARTCAAAAAVRSLDSGNNSNWIFAVASETNTWLGAVSTNWGKPGNWSLARTPIWTDDQTIIANGPFDPGLPSDQAFNKLEIQAGAALNLEGYNLTVADATRVVGALNAFALETIVFAGDADFTDGSFSNAGSTVVLAGPAPQAITSAGESFHRLTVVKPATPATFVDLVAAVYLRNEASSVAFNGGVVATQFLAFTSGTTVTQTFGAGSMSVVRELQWLGSPAAPIVLDSASPGTSWGLDVGLRPYVKNVGASDSDANAGQTIHPIASVDGGGNSNWVFGAAWATWDGSDSSDFADSNNWAESVAPGAATRVVIDGNYVNEPLVSAPTSVREIIMGGSEISALTVDAALGVAEDVTVSGLGTLTLNKPVTLGGDFSLLDGALVTHDNNTTSEDNKIDVTVGGNLTVDAFARVDADFLGWQTGWGPSDPPGGNYYGGSHGGRGGSGQQNGSGTPSGITYGDIREPTELGSAGGHGNSDGGGAIRLAVAGATLVNGTLTASGDPASQFVGGGSGGSVYLATAALAGTGSVWAVGGTAYDGGGQAASGGGGGGRVAVLVTASDTLGGVTIRAYGGQRDDIGTGIGRGGAAGTVYTETQAQGGGRGLVTIDNNDHSHQHYTYIPAQTNYIVDEIKFAGIVVTNGASMNVTTSAVARTLIMATGGETLDLGNAANVLQLGDMTIDGTLYRSAGLYMTNDWNGFATPTNVVGEGAILIAARGTVLLLR